MTTATRHSAPKHAPIKPKTGIDAWKGGIDKADDKWNAYDCLIRSTIQEYDLHLSRSPGYVSLNWKLVKAMLWTETGAKDRQWGSKPMQIGNLHDPGMAALLADNQGGELVMPPSIRVYLSAGNVTTDPAANIRAGIGYLLMRMAEFRYVTVMDSDSKVYEVTVGQHDTIDKLAKANGSTRDIMMKLNSAVHILRPGQVLKYRKGSVQKVIVGWNSISASSIATRYNASSHTDLYESRLNYSLDAMKNRADIECK